MQKCPPRFLVNVIFLIEFVYNYFILNLRHILVGLWVTTPRIFYTIFFSTGCNRKSEKLTQIDTFRGVQNPIL